MNLSPKHLIKILEQNGFIFKRSKGSHQLYYNPATNKQLLFLFIQALISRKEHTWQFSSRQELIHNDKYFEFSHMFFSAVGAKC